MDNRNGHPISTRIPRDQQIRTCRPAVVKTGKRADKPERDQDNSTDWNIVRGED